MLDADTRRVLWIGEGRSRTAIRPFFEELGPEGCARIEAVAMDMNTAFDLEVRQHCPKTRVVYDLFHVVAKYGREVIGRGRVDDPTPYSQPKYGTCLDLGAWGAVYTEGWDRQVKLVKQEGKNLKTQINTVWIYPPAANRETAWAAADPLIPIA